LIINADAGLGFAINVEDHSISASISASMWRTIPFRHQCGVINADAGLGFAINVALGIPPKLILLITYIQHNYT
jgi:hypothetical protein